MPFLDLNAYATGLYSSLSIHSHDKSFYFLLPLTTFNLNREAFINNLEKQNAEDRLNNLCITFVCIYVFNF